MADEGLQGLEWYLVDPWLCARLHDIGEVTIDNGLGTWWGRTCTGQGLIMDGTLQQIAAQVVDAADRVVTAEGRVLKLSRYGV